MKLKQWDWEKGQFVEIDYPDEPIKEFIDYLRNSKSWWYGEEGLGIVHRQLQKMDDLLAEFRHNDGSKPVAVAEPVPAVEPEPVAEPEPVEPTLRQKVTKLAKKVAGVS